MDREIKDQRWLQKWKQNRKHMTWIAYILILMYGIEIMSVVVSMVYYIQINFRMNKDRASFYYALVETSCGIGQITGCIFIGRYVDQTRNLKFAVMVNLMFIMIGNFLYAVPFHLAFLMVGRFLAGMNESLQTAICGEFRRCYENKELIRILGYYEVIFSIGVNVGPGLTIIFHSLDIQIGTWAINQYNGINLIIAFLTFFLLIVSWFVVHDLSKEYDQKLQEEHLLLFHKSQGKECQQLQHVNQGANFSTPSENQQEKSIVAFKSQTEEHYTLGNSNSIDTINKNNKLDYSERMIGWKDLVQIDILLLSFTYGVMRLAAILTCTVTSMIGFGLFLWPVEYLSGCHIVMGVSSYVMITVLVHKRAFEGETIFFTYIIGCILAMLVLISLALPRAVVFSGRVEQTIYMVSIIFANCFSYFGQTQGKFLIFNSVNHESASFVDSFRSIVGSGFRLIGLIASYKYFLTPIYFAGPIGIVQISMIGLLLFRKYTNLI